MDKQVFEAGKQYFIRTVTVYHTGRCKEVRGNFLVLEDAAWIPDTGRFSSALKNGTFQEVEPFPGECFVHLACVIDACEWPHALPRSPK